MILFRLFILLLSKGLVDFGNALLARCDLFVVEFDGDSVDSHPELLDLVGLMINGALLVNFS